jgi:hypothetical protein
MLHGLRSLVSRFRLDVLCSTSDWAFMMAEADALQTEDPSGCMETALIRAKSRGERRYALVAAELSRRLALPISGAELLAVRRFGRRKPPHH